MLGYDSDNISDIPTQAEVIAFYNDGEPGTATPEQLAQFPNAHKYSITRKTGVTAYWMDVETGAATIQDFINAFKAGEVKGLYIQESRIQSELEPAVTAANVSWFAGLLSRAALAPSAQSGFDLWAASWNNQYQGQLVPGSVWTQVLSPSSNPSSGGHFDVSVIYSNWVPKDGTNINQGVNEPVSVTPIQVPPEPPDDKSIVDATGQTINAPVVAAFPTPSGQGYILVAADGGVFTFGDATFHGSLSEKPLNQPIVSAFVSKSGLGYTLVAADGGVFPFGDAPFEGAL